MRLTSLRELNALCDSEIFKMSRTDSAFTYFFKRYQIFRGTNITLLSSQCRPFRFRGLPLLAVILVFYSHHWQINLIMCRAKTITVSLQKASEIQGLSLEIGAEPTLDHETYLNIQQLQWPSLNLLKDTKPSGSSQTAQIKNLEFPMIDWKTSEEYWNQSLFSLAASRPLWTNFGQLQHFWLYLHIN